MTRYADLDPAMLRRACKLAQLPSVTLSAAAERFGISVGMLRRALKEYGSESFWTRGDLVLHCLSRAGEQAEGELGDLSTLASYLDYVNKDGSTAEAVKELIDGLVADGRLEVEGQRWRLVGEFP